MEKFYKITNTIIILLEELDCILQNMTIESSDVSNLIVSKVDNIQKNLGDLYGIFSSIESNLKEQEDNEVLLHLVQDLFSLVSTKLFITSILNKTNNMVLKSTLIATLVRIEDQISQCILNLKTYYE